MCDASDFTIGAVLGKRKTKHIQPIHHASKTMTEAQIHYTTTEKEMLAVVYAFEKFRPYLILSKSIVYTDHSSLKYLLNKQDAKLRLLRRVLLIQEFDIIIHDKKGTKNLAADHLYRLENPHKDVLENKDINENFLLETLGKISSESTPWFADFANYHARNLSSKGCRPNKRRNSLRTLNTIFGMTPICLRFVRIKSFDGVCMAKKLMISSKLVMKDPPGPSCDRSTYFCNEQFAKVMLKYGVTHRLSTAYHPQTSGQVEVSNRGLKRIIERTVGENRASWSEKLEDALWAFRTAYKTPIRALKHANFDLKTAGNHRKLQLNELNELRDQAYENSLIYKEKTKKFHDSKIKNRIFNVGDRVLLFNSRPKIFSKKLKTRWTGPFTVAHVFPYGTIELSQADGPNFMVNAVLPSSLVLSQSPISDSQDFFPSEEILPKDTETSISPSSSVGSSSPIRSTISPLDYPFDESIFTELDNSLWITPQPLGEEPGPEEPNELDTLLWK
nr:reverse transcriptase domain-containing protein [Tanacetum cinerariifolium]